MHLSLLIQSMEVSQDAATFIDLDGRVAYANPAAGDLLGCKPYDVTGRFLWDLIDDPEKVAHIMETTIEHGQWRGEVGVLRQSDRILVSWRTALIQSREGEMLGIISLGGALISQKEMVRHFERFERQRLLGELAAGLAHNINQIFTIILGRAFLLQDETLSDRAKDEIQKMVEAANQGATLVNRIQRGVMEAPNNSVLPAINLNQITQICVETTRPKWHDEALRKGSRIDVESDLKTSRLIAGHSDGIEGVLMNLIFNAVDAMPQGGRIDIRTYDEVDWVCMSVSDTGTGMDQKTRERLGELFFTTKTNGHGIGLATCFRTVRDLSGTIEVESAPGKGSTFLLRFPALAQIHSDPVPAPVGSTTSCRILVIDDEPSIQSFLLQALSKHVVDAVGDGETGLEMFRENPYDVVFIDLSLPGIDGVAVAQHMRTLSENVSLVLMTGWENLSEETNAYFQAVLHKPFSLHALIGLMNNIVKKSATDDG